MNIKEFFKRWAEGIKTLPPTAQLRAKIQGIIGAIVGMILGFTMMAIKGNPWFLLLGFFLVWLQVVDLIGTKQQYENAKKMEELIKKAKENEHSKT